MIKLFNKYRILTGLFILLLFPLIPVSGQVVVERSKEKTIISGVPFYLHNVKKGETAYSISKAYNVTVEELTRENPQTVYGVKEGQALRIPVRDQSAVTAPQVIQPVKNKDESKFVYHRIQAGETVYSLSRLYGVSENDIINSNSGLDINKLPLNAEIAIPRKDFATAKEQFKVQDERYTFHKVIKGESLSSIAEKYGMTVRELRKENRDIRFPQVGDYLRIPSKQPPVETVIAETQVIDTVVAVKEPEPLKITRPSEYTTVKDLNGSFNVAVLLPFYLSENAVRTEIDSSKFLKGKRQYKLVKRPDEWIYKSSIGFVEMYEGILLAVDTLRAMGLNVNLNVFDIKGDTIGLTKLFNQGVLSTMDLIIGPVHSGNLTRVAEYAGRFGIPVVSPVQLFSSAPLYANPTLFLASPSLKVIQDKMALKASESYRNNFVFIHNDTTENDADVKYLRTKLLNEISLRLPANEIRYKELLFYSRSTYDNDSINRLAQSLSAQMENTIIIASEEDPVISETLQEIHSLSRKFPVKVFCYPLIRGNENLDSKYLFDLDLLVFSPFWIDYAREDVKHFTARYRKVFMTEPSEISYAWTGYDITYYFLSGLALHGKEFIAHPEIHNPDLIQTEFDFRRTDVKNGFENCKLFPVRYTKEYDIRLIPSEDPGIGSEENQ